MRYLKHSMISGPTQGQAPASHPRNVLKKKRKEKKYTFWNKKNLWWNKNIRLTDLAEASKLMIGPFRSYIIWSSSKLLPLQNSGAPSDYIQ